MKIIVSSIVGLVGGLFYALISFYFFMPILRNNMVVILFFGLQGLIFGLVYSLLKLLSRKTVKKETYKLLINIGIGMMSGLLSCTYNVVVTYYNLIISSPLKATAEVRMGLIAELISFSLGGILTGAIIGFIIGLWEKQKIKLKNR